MQRRGIVACGLALALGAAPSSAVAPSRPDGAHHRRVERTFRFDEPWTAACSGDACAAVEVFRLPVETPAGVASIDVTVTVTFDYRTGPGPDDAGVVGAEHAPAARGPYRSLGPSWPLAPAPRRAASTIVWQKHGLDANGKRHFFVLAVASRERGDAVENENFVRGRRVTVVVEMWPAGP